MTESGMKAEALHEWTVCALLGHWGMKILYCNPHTWPYQYGKASDCALLFWRAIFHIQHKDSAYLMVYSVHFLLSSRQMFELSFPGLHETLHDHLEMTLF